MDKLAPATATALCCDERGVRRHQVGQKELQEENLRLRQQLAIKEQQALHLEQWLERYRRRNSTLEAAVAEADHRKQVPARHCRHRSMRDNDNDQCIEGLLQIIAYHEENEKQLQAELSDLRASTTRIFFDRDSQCDHTSMTNASCSNAPCYRERLDAECQTDPIYVDTAATQSGSTFGDTDSVKSHHEDILHDQYVALTLTSLLHQLRLCQSQSVLSRPDRPTRSENYDGYHASTVLRETCIGSSMDDASTTCDQVIMPYPPCKRFGRLSLDPIAENDGNHQGDSEARSMTENPSGTESTTPCQTRPMSPAA